MGRKVHCHDPLGESKEKIIILNKKIFHPAQRQKQLAWHHLSPMCTFDTDR